MIKVYKASTEQKSASQILSRYCYENYQTHQIDTNTDISSETDGQKPQIQTFADKGKKGQKTDQEIGTKMTDNVKDNH